MRLPSLLKLFREETLEDTLKILTTSDIVKDKLHLHLMELAEDCYIDFEFAGHTEVLFGTMCPFAVKRIRLSNKQVTLLVIGQYSSRIEKKWLSIARGVFKCPVTITWVVEVHDNADA